MKTLGAILYVAIPLKRFRVTAGSAAFAAIQIRL